MNADQMINHMMTVIYTTADVEGIQVTRHFRPQEIGRASCRERV